MYFFDGMTALDAVGPFDLLNRIPGVTFAIVGDGAGPKEAQGGLTLTANHDLDDVVAPEVILMPGGGPRGVEAQTQNPRLLRWLATQPSQRDVDDIGMHRRSRPRHCRATRGKARNHALAGTRLPRYLRRHLRR